MLNLGNFDEVKESGTPKPKLKEGYNDVIITDAVLKDNKAGTGKYIQVDVVNDNDAQGSSFFNVEHTKEQVQNIGRGQFKSLCLALGYSAWVVDLNEIIGKSIIAVVKLEDSTFLGSNGEMVTAKQARIVGFKPFGFDAPVVAAEVDEDTIPF